MGFGLIKGKQCHSSDKYLHYLNVAIIDTSRRDMELDAPLTSLGNTIMSNNSVCDSKAALSEVADYLSYLKHAEISKPVVNEKSLNLATAIATGLGDINDFGVKNKHKQLFAGAITFHRNKLLEMTLFFNQNKEGVLSIINEVIETKLDGCWIGLAISLANGYSGVDDVAVAYQSLIICNSELSSKQKILRNTIMSNLVRQTLLYAEAEYEIRNHDLAS